MKDGLALLQVTLKTTCKLCQKAKVYSLNQLTRPRDNGKIITRFKHINQINQVLSCFEKVVWVII